MGAFNPKPFERNDEIDGQGKMVLKLAKRFLITKKELDRLYHEFLKYSDRFNHRIVIADMFQKIDVAYYLYFQVLFQLYDVNKTATLNFQEFVVIMWAFLSINDDGIAALSFALFDINRSVFLNNL
jgi:hypothetical protein